MDRCPFEVMVATQKGTGQSTRSALRVLQCCAGYHMSLHVNYLVKGAICMSCVPLETGGLIRKDVVARSFMPLRVRFPAAGFWLL